ncbi:MAG: hypothetical protein AB1810_10825 [Pseudomonadota bacterium]
MDRNASRPLTPAEAKARLRAVAQEAGLTNWIGRHKWPILAAAMATGFLAGRRPVPVAIGMQLMRRLTPILLTMLLRKRL